MPKKKKNIFDIILNVIIILLAILVIYWFIQLIFGGSPGLSEFNFLLIIMMASFFIKIYREVGEIKIGMRYSFNRIKEDMGLLKEDMSSLKDDMGLIKKGLKIR